MPWEWIGRVALVLFILSTLFIACVRAWFAWKVRPLALRLHQMSWVIVYGSLSVFGLLELLHSHSSASNYALAGMVIFGLLLGQVASRLVVRAAKAGELGENARLIATGQPRMPSDGNG